MERRPFLLIVVPMLGILLASCGPQASYQGATEFCLRGQLDLGLRYQGTRPEPSEWVPTTWCITTEAATSRVVYSATGKGNPDIDDNWAVAYLPPDTVRILNRDTPPDVEFHGTNNLAEALRVRRVDPRRLLEELGSSSDSLEGVRTEVRDGRVLSVATTADLPLRGSVPVVWQWTWPNDLETELRLLVDGSPLFEATGSWRELDHAEAEGRFARSPGVEPIEAPADRWPAKVSLRLSELAEGVSLVRGVRSGFQHLVVDTDAGLVVADAPAGWVQFHHIPPADLVPGLGVSGLSEKLVDFLQGAFPQRPIKAVVLTHFHDDHAGGARAFAAAGAEVYANIESAGFLELALNASRMPPDRLTETGARVKVVPVSEPTTLGSGPNRVTILPMGSSPHTEAMAGVLVPDKNIFFVSDVHVPRADSDVPRAGREQTECWFAGWATARLSATVEVVNSHSPEVTPVSRLARYLASDACLAAATD